MRKPRLEFQGALYHVIARGNHRQDIFLDAGDYVRYLKALGETASRHGFKLYAYCLMTNHVHLLVRQTTTFPLSKVMQRLQSAYTSFFNRKHHKSGHLFQGRYKAILVDGDSYLVVLSRYIHLNPYRAKMEKVMGKYAWTSYQQYLDKDKKPLAEVDSLAVLSMFAKIKAIARKRYQTYLLEGLQEGHREDLYDLRSGRILGNEEFEEEVYKEAGTQDRTELKLKKSIDEIWKTLLEREDIEIEPRGWIRSRLMGEAAYWIVESAGKTQKEVADHFGVDPASISRAIKRQIGEWEKDQKLRKRSVVWIRNV